MNLANQALTDELIVRRSPPLTSLLEQDIARPHSYFAAK
jgi:hypothetical protein